MLSPTVRFSTRVENYVRYRPGYPDAVLAWLRAECDLTPAAVVADIGSGTGKLAELFLRNGNRVFGVEPNREMREAGEGMLAGFPNFVSVDGAAEATTLPAASVDFVTAGQAFHWFDRQTARREFARILKPGGWVVLVWNERRSDSPFLRDYEALLREFASEYEQVPPPEPERRRHPQLARSGAVPQSLLRQRAVVRLRGSARAPAILVLRAGTRPSQPRADDGRPCRPLRPLSGGGAGAVRVRDAGVLWSDGVSSFQP